MLWNVRVVRLETLDTSGFFGPGCQSWVKLGFNMRKVQILPPPTMNQRFLDTLPGRLINPVG